jgi:hypothetical protein
LIYRYFYTYLTTRSLVLIIHYFGPPHRKQKIIFAWYSYCCIIFHKSESFIIKVPHFGRLLNYQKDY